MKVERVVCAVDCGIVVNPDQVHAQVESAVVFGLTAALRGKITIKDGAVEQSNFHDYPLLRMNEIPIVEVHVVQSADKPTGIGEPGTPPIAPAVANAIFAATGSRLRSLPLTLTHLTDDDCRNRVLIAGGGIGGLTCALALARRQLDVHVFEQAATFGEIGAGIQLSPNCVRVLHELGLEAAPAADRVSAGRHADARLEDRQG